MAKALATRKKRAVAVQPEDRALIPTQATAETAPEALAKSPAEQAYERLVLYIRNFETQLDQSQEIAMGFTGSDAGVLRIEGLGFLAPDILSFYGRDEEGMKTQLVQHVSQLSVLLRAVPKTVPEAPPLRIGFRLNGGWSGGEAGDASVRIGDES